MRKKLLKIFGLVSIFAIALTGCATVSSISNPTPDEVLYSGGSVVQVGDYLYYANAYTAVGTSSTDFAYKDNAKLSYLNRANLAKGFTNKIESPVETAKVNSKVVGFEQSYMFVLGDYIYYTSPSTHKNKQLNHTYNLVSLFRSKLNGDSVKEIMTTDQFNASTAQMRVLKGSDKNYYWIVYDGTEITSIKIGNTIGKKQVIAKDVTSLALPNGNEEFDVAKIFYTTTVDKTPRVCYVDYATGKSDSATCEEAFELRGRQGDTIFYKDDDYETKYKTVTKSSGLDFSGSRKLFDMSDVDEIHAAYQGYVFVASNALVYKNTVTNAESVTLLQSDEFSQILHVDDEWIYYSTGSEIKMLSVRGVQKEEDVEKLLVVTMKSSITGSVSVVDDYLYFYAGLEPLSDDDEAQYKETKNLYLYRVKMWSNQDYQILSNFTRTEIED